MWHATIRKVYVEKLGLYLKLADDKGLRTQRIFTWVSTKKLKKGRKTSGKKHEPEYLLNKLCKYGEASTSARARRM